MYKADTNPIPITINFDATVTSFGGVGISFFMRFFEKFIRLNCSHNTELIKHTDTPPLTFSTFLPKVHTILKSFQKYE
ncbi:hypothetical protein FJR11_02115 [Anabaena sp. UHCC 0187]|nr:hypothetical protein [Anabaena sp. UHCC 0187]